MDYHAYYQKKPTFTSQTVTVDSHRYVATVSAPHPEAAFKALQANFMTRKVFKQVCAASTHTSLSVGDALLGEDGRLYAVDPTGFFEQEPVTPRERFERFRLLLEHADLWGTRAWDALLEQGAADNVKLLSAYATDPANTDVLSAIARYLPDSLNQVVTQTRLRSRFTGFLSEHLTLSTEHLTEEDADLLRMYAENDGNLAVYDMFPDGFLMSLAELDDYRELSKNLSRLLNDVRSSGVTNIWFSRGGPVHPEYRPDVPADVSNRFGNPKGT